MNMYTIKTCNVSTTNLLDLFLSRFFFRMDKILQNDEIVEPIDIPI